MDGIRVDWEELEAFTTEVFVSAGLPRADAELEAEVLVWANLRGIDSHGVLRVPSYLDNIGKGLMNPKPNIRIMKETPAVLFVDADRAMGPVVTVFAMERVIEKAKNVGIGWALLRNNTHQGAMAYYPLMAARENMAGIAIVCSPPNMAPHGAKAAGLHNSPIAIAVPSERHKPLVLDMATSIVAGGKLMVAADKGVPLGEGWALDASGNPTTDPGDAKVLVPCAGPKGSGLALMFQCLASLMAGNPLLVPVLRGGDRSWAQNGIVAAIDVELFGDVETYKENVDTLVDELKALPREDGFDEILMPGEPEEQVLADRTRNGIPLPPGTVGKMRDAAGRSNVELPGALRPESGRG
ncbi:MAG: Ldh family oxidoreductase [Candidatus Latescibacteria bacterium]|nr:Ldh family oxidoreductase [Candidatus Latescibacterota bacterium]